ncbi:MAG: tRNA 2-thiouridine(34) synthase MnmA [Anaerolineae bacterium]|nr:tRNA 2-thiouridine(34) synthase MnmA [Anaerolineae bacterium]
MHIFVGLSGGVDSGVAAALLVEQGHRVQGVMLQTWAESGTGRGNLCCTPEAIDRARAVADRLGIPFHLVDGRAPFHAAVVEPFIAEYAAARTPNPCIACNREVRFGFLLDWVRRQGGEYLATGHYARIRHQDGRFRLLRGLDPAKDQSYMLHALSQAQLRHALFPLGKLTKTDVRAIAHTWDMAVADQPDSQDVCFLADGDYRRFLAERAPEAVRPGPIVDAAGSVLGKHTGLVNYTIGQRKGIGIPAPHPLYVLGMDPQRNALVVGPAQALGRWECTAAPMHYIAGEAPRAPFRAEAKIRYRHRGVPVTATPLPGGCLHVRFERPQRDVTPGQYLVLYQGEDVLGGGAIRAPWDAP